MPHRIETTMMIIFGTTRGVWLANNQFRAVDREVWDEAAILAANAERQKKFLGSTTPMAVWDFDQAKADATGALRTVPDAAGQASRYCAGISRFHRILEPADSRRPGPTRSSVLPDQKQPDWPSPAAVCPK